MRLPNDTYPQCRPMEIYGEYANGKHNVYVDADGDWQHASQVMEAWGSRIVPLSWGDTSRESEALAAFLCRLVRPRLFDANKRAYVNLLTQAVIRHLAPSGWGIGSQEIEAFMLTHCFLCRIREGREEYLEEQRTFRELGLPAEEITAMMTGSSDSPGS